MKSKAFDDALAASVPHGMSRHDFSGPYRFESELEHRAGRFSSIAVAPVVRVYPEPDIPRVWFGFLM